MDDGRSVDIALLLRAWVTRSQGLSLKLTVPASSPSVGKFYSVAEEVDLDLWMWLGREVCAAELWQQLGLVATMSDGEELRGVSEDRVTKLNIALSQRREPHDAKKQQGPHRFCYGNPSADLQPPIGIDIFQLCEIRIHITLSKTERKPRKRKRPKERSRGNKRRRAAQSQSSISEPSTRLLSQDVLSFDGSYDFDGQCARILPSGRFPNHTPSSSQSVPSQVRFETASSQAADADDALFFSSSEVDDKDLFACTDPHALNNETHTEQVDEEVEALAQTKTHFLQLIDAVIRFSIHPDPMRPAAGIVKIDNFDDDLSAHLAEVAPYLFSPDYAFAMSTRAMLLPVMARNLSLQAHDRATSEVFEDRLEGIWHLNNISQIVTTFDEDRSQFQALNDDLVSGEATAAGRRRKSLLAAATAALWRHIQTQCFDENAARKLRPIRPARRDEQSGGMDPDDLFAGADMVGDEMYFERAGFMMNQFEHGDIGIDLEQGVEDDLLFDYEEEEWHDESNLLFEQGDQLRDQDSVGVQDDGEFY